MKLICDPLYTLSDTRKCIAHFSVNECARSFLKADPEAFVYYIAPTRLNDPLRFTFEKDLEKEFPGRVMYWDGDQHPNNRVFQMITRPEWFGNIVAGAGFAWDWDVMLSMRNMSMDYVRWLNWQPVQDSKAIVIQDHFPLFHFKHTAASYYRDGKDDLMQLSLLSSYAAADYIRVGAPYEVRSILNTARRFLAPAVCKRLQERVGCGFVIPSGLDLDYPLKKEGRGAGKTQVGIFTQRLGASGRKPEDILNTFFYAFVPKKPGTVEFRLSTNSAIDLPEDILDKCSFVTFYKSIREEFYERLREADFCLSFSTTEGLPTSILEAICWGCIPILIRLPWSEDLAGPNYPLLFDSHEQAVALVNRVIEQPVWAFEMYQRWYAEFFRPYLERHGRLDLVVQQAAMDQRERSHAYLSTCGPTSMFIREMLDFVDKKKMKRFTLKELLLAMFKSGALRNNPNQLGVGEKPVLELGVGVPPARMPNYYGVLHRLLHATGWKRGLQVGEIIVA